MDALTLIEMIIDYVLMPSTNIMVKTNTCIQVYCEIPTFTKFKTAHFLYSQNVYNNF